MAVGISRKVAQVVVAAILIENKIPLMPVARSARTKELNFSYMVKTGKFRKKTATGMIRIRLKVKTRRGLQNTPSGVPTEIEPTSVLCFGITACAAKGTRAAGESRRDATAKQGTKCRELNFSRSSVW